MNAREIPPPHDLDAEAAVLSALMLDGERFAGVELILTPADFYSEANREIARCIWELDRENSAIDITTIATRLQSLGLLAKIGGTVYLAQLTDSTPAVAHVEDHARIVAAAARIRRVQAVCRLAVAEGYTALGDPMGYFKRVEQRVFETLDATALGQDTIEVLRAAVSTEYQALVEASQPETAPVRRGRTRISALDRILEGLVDAVPYVLAGRPGHGKTAAGWQIAEGIARGGELVVFLSQEMPRQQLVQRGLCQAANIEPAVMRKGKFTPEEWQALADAMSAVEGLPIAIDDRGGHTVYSVHSSVRRCVQRLRAAGHEGRLGLVVVDYLQIMADERRGGDNRSTAVAENMHGLTMLAKELRCPFLVLAQLNRDIEKRTNKRPQLSDLGESGAIEQDAYGVLFVYREDMYREEALRDGRAEIIVAKHRNGRSGTADLRYLPSTLFVGVADEFDGIAQSGENWHDESDRRYP